MNVCSRELRLVGGREAIAVHVVVLAYLLTLTTIRITVGAFSRQLRHGKRYQRWTR